MTPVRSLDDLQRIVAIALSILSLVHVPVIGLLAWSRDFATLPVTFFALILAAAPVLMLVLRRPPTAVGAALAVTLIAQTSLMVFLMKGHPWQVEAHFYYFAVLAMLSGFCDLRILVFAAALIAVQHLGFNHLYPAALYPGGTDLGRVALHAFVVVIETIMLAGIAWTIRTAFQQAETGRQAAVRAAAKLQDVLDDRSRELNVTSDRAQAVEEVMQVFEKEMTHSIAILHDASEVLRRNADSLGAASERSNAQTATAIVTADDTSMKVRRAAQAGDELAMTITEVETNAAQSLQLANQAVSEAQMASVTIDDLAAVADEIGKVTDLISAIASQTNLLALNATIEAARAGDAGRGFAVVAQEVKELAGQTGRATQDIARRITAIQSTTSRSVEAIQSIGRTIRELDSSQTRIAAAVQQQAIATREIAGNVNAAAIGVNHLAQAVAQIEQVSEQSAMAVTQFGDAARDVTGQAGTIRARVKEFTSEIQKLETASGAIRVA